MSKWNIIFEVFESLINNIQVKKTKKKLLRLEVAFLIIAK